MKYYIVALLAILLISCGTSDDEFNVKYLNKESNNTVVTPASTQNVTHIKQTLPDSSNYSVSIISNDSLDYYVTPTKKSISPAAMYNNIPLYSPQQAIEVLSEDINNFESVAMYYCIRHIYWQEYMPRSKGGDNILDVKAFEQALEQVKYYQDITLTKEWYKKVRIAEQELKLKHAREVEQLKARHSSDFERIGKSVAEQWRPHIKYNHSTKQKEYFLKKSY